MKKYNSDQLTFDRCKKLNFKSNKNLSIDPASIPTLTPDDKVNLFMEGDSDPYYKIQEIEYPIKANGWVYTEEFFKSFLSKTKERPIPGSRNGHSTRWGEFPPTDLLLIGGKVESKGNGKGKAYFKNYIPKALDSDNASFIKQAKADMVHFSLVSVTRDEKIINKDGEIEWHVIESLSDERNDAVEYNAGAMSQKTNAANAVEDIKSKGDTMDELLKQLLNHKANGKITVSELATAFGIETRTDEDKQNADLVSKFTRLFGNLENAQKMVDESKQNAIAGMKAKVVETFGTEKVNGKDNRAHQYAMTLLSESIDAGDTEKFNTKIESLKDDPIAVEFKAALGNPFSKENSNTGEADGGGDGNEVKVNHW